MNNNIQIQKEDLKQILLTLIKKIDTLDTTTIYLNKDLYWNIPYEELYNVYEEPKEITIGSIKEDLEFLQKINENREIISYDFIKISNILRVMSESIS